MVKRVGWVLLFVSSFARADTTLLLQRVCALLQLPANMYMSHKAEECHHSKESESALLAAAAMNMCHDGLGLGRMLDDESCFDRMHLGMQAALLVNDLVDIFDSALCLCQKLLSNEDVEQEDTSDFELVVNNQFLRKVINPLLVLGATTAKTFYSGADQSKMYFCLHSLEFLTRMLCKLAQQRKSTAGHAAYAIQSVVALLILIKDCLAPCRECSNADDHDEDDDDNLIARVIVNPNINPCKKPSCLKSTQQRFHSNEDDDEEQTLVPSKVRFCDCTSDLACCNRVDEQGKTDLIRAVQQNNEAEVRRLLSWEKIDLNIQDKSGQSALSYAVEYGEFEIVQLLLGAGATITDDMVAAASKKFELFSGRFNRISAMKSRGAREHDRDIYIEECLARYPETLSMKKKESNEKLEWMKNRARKIFSRVKNVKKAQSLSREGKAAKLCQLVAKLTSVNARLVVVGSLKNKRFVRAILLNDDTYIGATVSKLQNLEVAIVKINNFFELELCKDEKAKLLGEVQDCIKKAFASLGRRHENDDLVGLLQNEEGVEKICQVLQVYNRLFIQHLKYLHRWEFNENVKIETKELKVMNLAGIMYTCSKEHFEKEGSKVRDLLKSNDQQLETLGFLKENAEKAEKITKWFKEYLSSEDHNRAMDILKKS